VGSNSTQYTRYVLPVAGETYVSPISQGKGLTATGIANTRTVTFAN
jgi:type IV pilus assembly protein PilA